MSRFFFYLLVIATLFISLAFAKKLNDTEPVPSQEDLAAAEEERIAVDALKLGALRVDSGRVLVPDASAERPMIISNAEDQPLCKPNVEIRPSRSIKVMDGYEVLVLTNEINNPRKMIIDPANHILVVSPENGIYSIRMDKCGNSNAQLIISNDQMDQPVAHGIAIFDHHLFVSTANSIYKFPYSDGQHSPVENGVKILTNINPDNAQAMPDIAVDPFGRAFVPRSVADIHDKLDASKAIIKKFNLKHIPEIGFDYNTDGEVQAYGTNTRGSMGFDAQARLWGINGIPTSEIKRSDISTDHDLSSAGLAEELNLYEFPETNYGFPYCMTEFNLKDISAASKGLGAQWAHPAFMNDSVSLESLDEYCQAEANNIRPSVPLMPNSIATSVHFYMGEFCSVGDLSTQGTSVGLPCNWTDTPILTNHGVAEQPSGHNVVRLHFDDLGHKPRWDKEPEVILGEAEPCRDSGCISPFGLAVDNFGRLLVSSDTTNEVFMVSRAYNQTAVKLLTDRANAEDDKDDSESILDDGEKSESSKPDDDKKKGSKKSDDDEEKGGSKKKDNDEEKGESKKKDNDEEKSESKKLDDDEEKGESKKKDNDEEKGESKKKDNDEEKSGSKKKDNDEEKSESKKKDNDEEKGGSKKKDNDDEEKDVSKKKDNDEEKSESKKKDNDEEKGGSKKKDNDDEEKDVSKKKDNDEEKSGSKKLDDDVKEKDESKKLDDDKKKESKKSDGEEKSGSKKTK